MDGAQEKTVELGEYRVNLVDAGSGRPIVMLHGREQGASWKDWKALSTLSDGYRLVIPDLVGFGKSSHPAETPDHKGQARVVHDLAEALGLGKFTLAGVSWGGQVALEVALEWPDALDSIVLVSSTFDKAQLPELGKVRKPTLIVWAEDDMVAQLKAGYVLRDALRTSRLEVLPPVAKDPRYDFRIAHRLLSSRGTEVAALVRRFLESPAGSTVEPPELEEDLKGMALKREKGK
jgi:pimeloyl-ACP methyl ester carboxylesterase